VLGTPFWIYARVKVAMVDALRYAVPCARQLRAATAASEIEMKRAASAADPARKEQLPRRVGDREMSVSGICRQAALL